MRFTVGVADIGDIECERLERLARNIRPGDVIRVDAGDGITARWVYVQIRDNVDAGKSWFRGEPQRVLKPSFPSRAGSQWGYPHWVPLGGYRWDSADRVEIFRPIKAGTK